MTFVEEIPTAHSPESLADRLIGERGLVLLRSALFDSRQARYSLLTARPLLIFRSFGSRCECDGPEHPQFGNPWHVLDSLMARYELLEEIDLPFPLGGCFGYWGYDLKNFVEPRLPRHAVNDLELPDCQAGFYDSLVVFDHQLGKTWIVSTGLQPDGSRDAARARQQLEFWRAHLLAPPDPHAADPAPPRLARPLRLQSHPRPIPPRRRTRPGLHPRRRYLSGQPFPAPFRPAP